MKKLSLLLVIVGLLAVGGCMKSQPDVAEREMDVKINGQTLRRITLDYGMDRHYIYYFINSPSQPITYNLNSGKTKRVVVFIDDSPVSTNNIKLP